MRLSSRGKATPSACAWPAAALPLCSGSHHGEEAGVHVAHRAGRKRGEEDEQEDM